MKTNFELNGTTLQVDNTATKNFYLTEVKITDNCDCGDCSFYANVLIKQPFEIFQILGEMGIDLSKNLSSESEGVWCVRDDNGELIHCDQTYQMFGTINTADKNEIIYSKFENGYRINAKFNQFKPDSIYIMLHIGRVSDDKVIIKF